jgi:membrane-associated phospholipid phosphatase
MADTVGARLGDLISTNGRAEGALLCLFVALIPFGAGWVYGSGMTRWRATALKVAGLLAALAVLAAQVCHRGWFVEVDHAATTWLIEHRTSALDGVALAATTVFGPAETAAMALLVAVAVAVRYRSYPCGLTIIATVGGAAALCSAMKLLVARARPPIPVQETLETDYSFPSGHVTGAAALFGILAVAVGLRRSQIVKRLLAIVASVAVVAVALSRLYLGVHWLTDVVAGAVLGCAVVMVGATVLWSTVDRHDASPSEHDSATIDLGITA